MANNKNQQRNDKKQNNKRGGGGLTFPRAVALGVCLLSATSFHFVSNYHKNSLLQKENVALQERIRGLELELSLRKKDKSVSSSVNAASSSSTSSTSTTSRRTTAKEAAKATDNKPTTKNIRATTKNNKNKKISVLWVWAHDADVPESSLEALRALHQNERVSEIRAYCGTRQCHALLSNLHSHDSDASKLRLSWLRVPDLAWGTPLQSVLGSQETLALLRLKLPGTRFERAIQTASVVAALGKDLKKKTESTNRVVYADPLLPSCYIEHAVAGLFGGEEDSMVQVYHASANDGLLSDVALLATSSTKSAFVVMDNLARSLVEAMQRHMPYGNELRGPDFSDQWAIREVFCDPSNPNLSCGDLLESIPKISSSCLEKASRAATPPIQRTYYLPAYDSHTGCPRAPNVQATGFYCGKIMYFAEGDEFQTLLGLQFLPRIDDYVDVNVGYPTFDQVRAMPGHKWKQRGKSYKVTYGKAERTPSVACKGNATDSTCQRCLKNKCSTQPMECPGVWSTSWPTPRRVAQEKAYFLASARWMTLIQDDNVLGWPPPSHVEPVMVGYKSDREVGPKLLKWFADRATESGIPLGVRDQSFAKALCAKGVPAVFSGCLTLGLREFLDPKNPKEPREAKKTVVFTRDGTYPADKAILQRLFPGFLTIAHNWGSKKDGIIKHLGATYNFVRKNDRQQLALETFRCLREAAGAITKEQFHVMIPSLGVGIPSISMQEHSLTESDTRFPGYAEHDVYLTVSERYGGVEGSLRVLANTTGPSSKAELLREKLVSRTRYLVAQHPPMLDAMHRLGPRPTNHDDAQSADKAWLEGSPPPHMLDDKHMMSRLKEDMAECKASFTQAVE